jgi:hypothetical protein
VIAIAGIKPNSKMLEKLLHLQNQLADDAVDSQLRGDDLLLLPELLRPLHGFKIFGDNLLAVPANLILPGEEEEFEKPFRFLDRVESIELFEQEFRPDIPHPYVQLGHLYGATEIVLLHGLKGTIHIVHVADIADKNWLNYKLSKRVCDLHKFIANIRPQTVCCLIDPSNYSKWDIFELRNGATLKTENDTTHFPNAEKAQEAYDLLVRQSLQQGYRIHYAPRRVWKAFAHGGGDVL